LNILLENPLPILAAGAVLATLCGWVFLSRRTLPALLALAMVVLLTLLLVVTERLIVTPREEVEVAFSTLLDAVESNDLPGVLALIDPAATNIRNDAETLMSMINVEDAGATAIEIDVDGSVVLVRCRGRLLGIHRSSGAAMRFFDKAEFQWVRRDAQWLLEDFVVYWKGKPMNAVGSLKENRVVP